MATKRSMLIRLIGTLRIGGACTETRMPWLYMLPILQRE